MVQRVGNAHVFYQSISEDRVAAAQALYNAMMAFPQLRVTQLLSNAIGCCEETKGMEIFYVTDAQMIQALNLYVVNFVNRDESEDLPPKGDLVPDTNWKDNRGGYEDRIRHFVMNSMDWQLYSSMPREQLEVAVTAINLSLRRAVESCSRATEARDKVYKVMDAYQHLGARDTEPECALCEALEYHYDTRVERG